MKNYIEEFMKDYNLEINQEFEIIPDEDYYVPIAGRFTDVYTLETRYLSRDELEYEENDDQLFLLLRDSGEYILKKIESDI